ncbi:hypothetical protein Indivirus_11_16 [Indivirus ILV1]|uniref:Transposase IS4-like domain-containing protein n=1 Tax=Indivirus ILV1 TaxID=1977633 RepID=A0A1V0SED3_9VIRU|nr:hypothetical protein Indivirus_11_16 [Indivirus ILV1]
MIKNINGKDNTGRNHYDRNRKGNKITVLVNCIGIPISIVLSPANIHDAKLTETIINNSVIKVLKTKIISDKGYITPIPGFIWNNILYYIILYCSK